jgi:uncharacterized membrane protein YfcA
MTEWVAPLLVLIAGFIAGIINTIAGSGSLITLPLLIFIGLPANVANGTNRVAILFQTAVGVWRFHQAGKVPFSHAKQILIPSVVGALLGAYLAVDLDEQAMRLVIAVIMVVMFVIILLRPKRWLQGAEDHHHSNMTLVESLVHFAIGFYGGFIQAGVGIFLLMGLVMASGYDLVRANALKLLIVLVFTGFALAVFAYNGMVNWYWGLVLAVGNVAGALVGTKLALRGGADFLRKVLLAIIALSALKMFYDVLA